MPLYRSSVFGKMPLCLRLYLAENLIWLPEGRKDCKSKAVGAANNMRTFCMCCWGSSVPNLLSLGQVDPQLSPCGEFLPVAEVVGHLLAGIARHQRRAVLHELVGCFHIGGTRWSSSN